MGEREPAPVADPGAINHAPADAVSSMEEVDRG